MTKRQKRKSEAQMPTRKLARMKPLMRPKIMYMVVDPDGNGRNRPRFDRRSAMQILREIREGTGKDWGHVAKVEIRELPRKRTR